MATLTDVQIYNLALADLGGKVPPISAFNDGSRQAKLGLVIYEPTVLELLDDHNWRFATQLVVLSNDPAATPAFGFSNACALPGDFVKVIKVNDNTSQFQRMGNHLHIDDDAPELTYVARVPESMFRPSFVTALAARLTMRACLPLTDNASAVENYTRVYSAKLADAKFADTMDGAPENPPMSEWDEARL